VLSLVGFGAADLGPESGRRRFVLRLRDLVLALRLIQVLPRRLDLLAAADLGDLADQLPVLDVVAGLDRQLGQRAAAARPQLPQAAAADHDPLAFDALRNAADDAPHDHADEHAPTTPRDSHPPNDVTCIILACSSSTDRCLGGAPPSPAPVPVFVLFVCHGPLRRARQRPNMFRKIGVT
jgi:hypothetical protein